MARRSITSNQCKFKRILCQRKVYGCKSANMHCDVIKSPMSDFSDSSQSGVISPATSFIENFHKKNGSTMSSSSPNMSTIGTTSPAINGTVVGGGGSSMGTAGTLATTLGRQINTSSSSSSSVKETSSTSQQV
uniref:Uncharacterized protein n=1 Tax=Glossina palpalis gambiensis TaxID=67801 RepID=A0A1B0B0E0_9MUSC